LWSRGVQGPSANFKRLMAKLGRPTASDVQLRQIDQVFERHANGEPLDAICTELGIKPSSFRTWMRKSPPLASEWDAVKREYVHSLFDKLASITMELSKAEYGKEDGAKVQALRAAQDGLKHITARLNPAQYGETKDKTGALTVIINTSLPLGPGDLPQAVVDGDFKVVMPLLNHSKETPLR
jgi:hypothetical protein